MFRLISHSVEQTEAAGEILGKRLGPGSVLAFFGGMGMGKTALTRGIVRGLGSTDAVSSPTFAIVNEYKGKDGPIHHFDMYRITSPEDLESTGYYDYLDGKGILIVEWSENVVEELPEGTIAVTVEKGDGENDRIITVELLSQRNGVEG